MERGREGERERGGEGERGRGREGERERGGERGRGGEGEITESDSQTAMHKKEGWYGRVEKKTVSMSTREEKFGEL